MTMGLLLVAFDYSTAAADEFHDWYDLEHVPERLRVPGFINAERWIGDDNPNLAVATYDLENHGVLYTPPYLAVGGANGANRLSGNAITEALVFGHEAGLHACKHAKGARAEAAAKAHESAAAQTGENPAALIVDLQALMDRHAGPLRNEAGLATGLEKLDALRARLSAGPPADAGGYDMRRLDWFDARTMFLVAETVMRAALGRRESRGAHVREDFPETSDAFAYNQSVRLKDGAVCVERV